MTPRSAVSLIGVLLASLVAAVPAGATAYGGNMYGPGGRDAGGATNLTWSKAQAPSGRMIGAGAHYAGSWTQYANYSYGYGYACHSFGTPNIGAMFINGDGSTFTIYGTYGTTSSC